MLDYIAYVSTQRHTAELANSARPDSPVVDDRVHRRNVEFGQVARNRIVSSLRWAADRLDPAQDCPPMSQRESI